jgi:hypothetical protein
MKSGGGFGTAALSQSFRHSAVVVLLPVIALIGTARVAGEVLAAVVDSILVLVVSGWWRAVIVMAVARRITLRPIRIALTGNVIAGTAVDDRLIAGTLITVVADRLIAGTLIAGRIVAGTAVRPLTATALAFRFVLLTAIVNSIAILVVTGRHSAVRIGPGAGGITISLIGAVTAITRVAIAGVVFPDIIVILRRDAGPGVIIRRRVSPVIADVAGTIIDCVAIWRGVYWLFRRARDYYRSVVIDWRRVRLLRLGCRGRNLDCHEWLVWRIRRFVRCAQQFIHNLQHARHIRLDGRGHHNRRLLVNDAEQQYGGTFVRDSRRTVRRDRYGRYGRDMVAYLGESARPSHRNEGGEGNGQQGRMHKHLEYAHPEPVHQHVNPLLERLLC